MTASSTPGKQSPLEKTDRTRIPVRSIAKQVDPSPSSLDKKVDRATMVAMVRSVANAKLVNADQTKDEMKEMKRIADIAEAIGDHETADVLRATLDGLVAAATS